MRRQPIQFRWLAVRVAFVLVHGASVAQAVEDLEYARGVFRDGLVLEVAGDWAAALAKFQEVGRTRLTPQVRYHLARCKEHLGRLTEALGDYRVAEAEARTAGLSETSEMERARRDLEVRVPSMLLRGGVIAASFHIELDGVSIGNSVLNRPMVLNPGQHQITLRNSKGVSRVLLVVAEEGKRLDVDLMPYDQNLVADPVGSPVAADEGRRGAAPTWAYIALGSGAAAAAASVVLFVVREQAKNELEQNCLGAVCPERLRSVQNRGEAVSIAAPVSMGLGIAGLGLGAWGLFGGAGRKEAGRKEANRAQRNTPTVSVAAWPGGGGVNFAARF